MVSVSCGLQLDLDREFMAYYYRYGLRGALLISMAVWSGSLRAHEMAEGGRGSLLPVLANGLLLSMVWTAYVMGSWRLRPKKGRGLVFHGATLIAVLFLFLPAGDWIEHGSALHMIQHMFIMVLVAPLYVLAKPWLQWNATGGRKARWMLKRLLRLGCYPVRMSLLQAFVIGFWHAPKFYNLALANPWWHLAEHISFALGAGLFWWSVLSRRDGTVLAALLFTMIYTGMLGALLTFAQTPLYGDLLDLQDQQLAGLIMWVPGGLPYLIAGVWCGWRWFRKIRSA